MRLRPAARTNTVNHVPCAYTRYQYDAFNQLVAVERNGLRSEYAYDALGRRVRKTTSEGTTEFLWDGDTLYGEHTPEGNRYYVFEPGSFRPLALIEPDGVYHYHLDHLGTPRELTDQSGNIVWQAAYRAYGSADGRVEQVAQPLRFQGQYFDEESGLHYNRFRYYDPQSGRFVHQDPIGLEGGINLYEYAPNPVGWIDPLGLSGDCPGNGDRPKRITPGSLPEEEEKAVLNTLQHIDNGTKPSGALSKKWGTKFKNYDNDLPGSSGASSPYREYRVTPGPRL